MLIAGEINATGRLLYWKVDAANSYSVGDYVIVENIYGYDLAKIIGITFTINKLAERFSNVDYKKMKKVVKKIDIDETTRVKT